MTFRTLMTGTALASLLGVAAFAQETAPADGAAADPVAPAEMPDNSMAEILEEPMTIAEMTVAEFLGLNVLSENGEDVGEIDYVIASGDGSEGQAVIGIGGFLGLGEYTVALPISAFDFDPESGDLIVNATEEELKATPEFDETGVEGVEGDVMMSEVMGDAGAGSGAMEGTAPMDRETDTIVDPDADSSMAPDAGTDMEPETDLGTDMDVDDDSRAEIGTESDTESVNN